MKYTYETNEGILTLKLDGDLIGEDSGLDLVAVANEYLSQDINKCVINISGLRYINSSGIGVLITILTKFRNKGGELFLVKPSENVQKLLIITKLNAIFNIVESEEEATSRLKETL